MEHGEEQRRLSLRERCLVVGVSSGFVLVLGATGWLLAAYGGFAALLDRIPKAFRAGDVTSAMRECLILAVFAVGYPGVLVCCLLGIYQGAQGRRTRLTAWILKELRQKDAAEERNDD